jgi:hypothetical protein
MVTLLTFMLRVIGTLADRAALLCADELAELRLDLPDHFC